MSPRVLLALAAAVAGAACVPVHPLHVAPGQYGPRPWPPGAQRWVAPGPSPVGRWDNVMLLQAGTRIRVLMSDGRQAVGHMQAADATTLQLRDTAGDLALRAADVMRVDLLPPSAAQAYARGAAGGAAIGAGAVGLLGLAFGGHVPARTVGAAALAGAANGVMATALVREPVTVYVAPVTAPRPAR